MARKKNWWEDPEPAKRGSTAKFTNTGTQFPRFVQPSRTSSRVPGRARPSEEFPRVEPRRGGRPRPVLPPVKVSPPPKPPGPPKNPPKKPPPYVSKPPTEHMKPPPKLPKTY